MRVQLHRTPFWLLLTSVLFMAPSAWLRAQQDERPNFGREAREGTPALDRDPTQPLNEREKIHHVLSRLTFGITPELMYQVEQMGLEKWIDTQLKDNLPEPQVLVDHLSKLETLNMTMQEIVKNYNPPLPPLSKRLTPEERRRRAELHRMRYIPRNQLKDAVLLRDVYGANQLKEVACNFWRNHFNVDVSKATVRYYATDYERTVIRGEALGTFAAMLNKQARHPAMLVYLDNYISRATPRRELLRVGRQALMESRDYATAMQAIDIAKMRGINENYARELMELHTLGVDNYYTQEDVITVANALTGWTVQQNPDKPIEFQFRRDMHASEPRIFLRRRIRANPVNPEMEGQAILDTLVRHKGTAEFIAYKLCRYFVADSPPPDMVKRVAIQFQRRKTDLPSVYKAIFTDPEFYNPKYYQAKFKTPLEYVVSALRVTHATISSTQGIHQQLVLMGEPIYQCEDPTGYYDQADAWRDPGVMANRWLFALALGMEQIRGVRIPPSFWEGLEPNNPLQWKEELTRRILPGGCTKKTAQALDDVIAKYARYNPRPEQLGRYIVGILLGSPEFQRQ